MKKSMKLYFAKTNTYNGLIITSNDTDNWRFIHSDNRGFIGGIDIYAKNAIEELKRIYENELIDIYRFFSDRDNEIYDDFSRHILNFNFLELITET